MFRSILVPLDGTSFSERALPMAREVARASGATVHLARVHMRKEPNALLGGASLQWQGVDLSEYDPKERRSEAEYLHAVEERLSSSGVAAGSELLEDRDLTDQLCDCARRVDADAIFMTSHARGGLDRMIHGSVAERVIRDSQLPVFIVHPTDGERDVYVSPDINHVLVPVDWSDLAGTVFGPVIDVSKAMGARVTLTSVVTPVVRGPRLLPIETESEDDDETRATRHLEEMAVVLRGEGLDVDVVVVSAHDPVRGIVLVADSCGADLIAMATHGFKGVRRTLAGSVSEGVLQASPLPIMMMRPIHRGLNNESDA